VTEIKTVKMTISDELGIRNGLYDGYKIDSFRINDDTFILVLVKHKTTYAQHLATVVDSVEISLEIQHIAELILNHAL